MTITIPPELETRIRGGAEAEGVTVEKYVERLLRADQHAEEELAALAIEGITSGEPYGGRAELLGEPTLVIG